jgi:biopolymer transport protein ExbB/TolQ
VILAHIANVAPLAMFQDAAPVVGFSPMQLLHNMGWPALCVVGALFIMSIYSLAVIIDRWLYFSAARKQSREFAPRVAGALKEGRLDEAIKVADRSKKSHLAEVVTAGLQEFRSYGSGGSITDEQIESSKRALERSESIVHAKLKKGLGGLATVGSTAPFIGLFGTVIGILNAFQSIATAKTSGIGQVAGGISEALVTTAFGLLVAIPAVMTFNYFTNKVEAFDVEMDNSSSELVDYFIKQSHR